MKPTHLRGALAAAVLALALSGCAAHAAKESVDARVLLAAGERAESAGDPDGALTRYVKALASPDVDPAAAVEAHFRVGRVHAALGNVATAREAFGRALAASPDHAGALEGLGLLFLAAGERPQAAALLQKALAGDPTRWQAANGLGILADLEGRHAEAQAYFSKVLEMRPGEFAAINNLGYSYYLGGQLEDALRQFEQAVARSPGNEKGWSNLSLVLARQGHYGRAVSTLERIMPAPEARYSIGYFCLLEGKLPEARRLLEDSIRVSSRYEPQAQAALKTVTEAEIRQANAGADD